jgi:hypothetical protein
MAVFVKERKSLIWHWRRDCSCYPRAADIAMITPQRPATGSLCEECQKIDESEKRLNKIINK